MINNMINTICICGAGTMGSGIAQVCAQSGFATILYDFNESILTKAKESIEKNIQYLFDKEKISAEEKKDILNLIHFTNDIQKCKADLIIEAIVEMEDAKVSLFNELAKLNDDTTIFATNTSSLSVSSLQKKINRPERLAGMHFFNPAYVMKLVEVIKGVQTNSYAIDEIFSVCKKMNKVPVHCKDSPGFIVNRIARHYYLEALKLVESGIASYENVDKILESTGFKMGPFKLMDLIGMDINLAVSQSIYEAFGNAERFKPAPLQKEKVKSNELGKKSGKGFYDYSK